MNRKICVVTGTRAEYGLLRWVMQGIKDDPALTLQVIVTGMHLSPEFGLTWREIERDGFAIDQKVEMLTSSDTAVGITKSMGLGLIGFADALQVLKPDLVLVLGDRFEILSAVSAALVARIPIAHLPPLHTSTLRGLEQPRSADGARDRMVLKGMMLVARFLKVSASWTK